MRVYYGAEHVIPLYIEVEDGERLMRAISREQKSPRYAELCRRFLADVADFSEDRLAEAGIRRRFQNVNFEDCRDELVAAIRKEMSAGIRSEADAVIRKEIAAVIQTESSTVSGEDKS